MTRGLVSIGSCRLDSELRSSSRTFRIERISLLNGSAYLRFLLLLLDDDNMISSSRALATIDATIILLYENPQSVGRAANIRLQSAVFGYMRPFLPIISVLCKKLRRWKFLIRRLEASFYLTRGGG